MRKIPKLTNANQLSFPLYHHISESLLLPQVFDDNILMISLHCQTFHCQFIFCQQQIRNRVYFTFLPPYYALKIVDKHILYLFYDPSIPAPKLASLSLASRTAAGSMIFENLIIQHNEHLYI